jgi:acetylornithine/succinyldiaminopimelate/putrescine aminotransferase/predicted amino acid dehydrogenase
MHRFTKYVNPFLGERLQQLNMDKIFVRGSGCELYDQSGNTYLDFIASYGALPFGFNHPEIWEAIAEVRQNGEPSFVQPSFLESAGLLAEKLIQFAPAGLKQITYTNSGTEANEAAFKMARINTGRLGILTTENSFHGKTLGSLSATGKDLYQKGFGAPVAGFERIPFDDPGALEAALRTKPRYYAAFIVEPIQGEGGIIIPSGGYLTKALELCRQYGTLLIVDEVQTGLGRTGKLFACEYEGIAPDILTIAKALGGGIMPIGACLSRDEVYTEDFGMKHSSTFAGNTLACRVGIKALEILTRDNFQLLKDVGANGDYLLKELNAIGQKYPMVIAAIRGRGLMIGLEFQTRSEFYPHNFLRVMAEQELLTPVISSFLLNIEHLRVAPTLNGATVIRLEPPLIISREQCQKAIASIERVAARLATGNTAGIVAHLVGVSIPDIESITIGKPAAVPSNDTGEGRFAFLVHPLYLQNYRDFDRSFKVFSEAELENLTKRCNDLIGPFLIGETKVISKTGQTAYGEFICASRTSEELLNLPREQVLSELETAIKLAKERGAKIVGLGAYTSVVSKGGRDLRDLGVALTTGNSYTVVVAVQATLEAAKRLKVPISETVSAVVGATGSIGRATALLLSEKVKSLYLIGNPFNQEHSRRRLMKVTAEIYQYLNQSEITGAGNIIDFVKHHPLVPDPAASLEAYQEFAEKVVEESPIVYTIELERYLPLADVIITATSQVNSLINPEMLKFGAIVCDVARPPDVSLEVKKARPDVLVIDGGIVAIPGSPSLGWDFGFEDGIAYACMSETMLLALEHQYRHFSLGIDINIDSIAYIRKLAAKHGFKLAGFRSFDLPLPDETWERVLQARTMCSVR